MGDCGMKTPHKHAELIKAWADGAEIEWKAQNGKWVDVAFNEPTWASTYEYRIKPEPKPDVVEFLYTENKPSGVSIKWHMSGCDARNLRLTFDGETGALKAAEVLK